MRDRNEYVACPVCGTGDIHDGCKACSGSGSVLLEAPLDLDAHDIVRVACEALLRWTEVDESGAPCCDECDEWTAWIEPGNGRLYQLTVKNLPRLRGKAGE